MFETNKRDDGTEFVTLNEDAPEWLKEAVRAAHQGDMPNDWIYAECAAAYEAWEEHLKYGGENDENSMCDWAHAHADGQVDIYTKDLFQWAADFCLTSTYSEAEERATETGSPQSTVEVQFRSIQYFALLHIAETIGATVLENAGDE